MRKPLIHTHCHLICCVYIKGHVSVHIFVWCWEVLRYIVLNACVKYCTKDQSNVKGVEGTLYGFQYIKCYVMLCMSKMLKMGVCGFDATLYTEYRSDVEGVKDTLDTVAPCSSGREGLYSLPSCGFSGSPPVSPRRQLCKLSWTCQLKGWLQARCTANPQFLN